MGILGKSEGDALDGIPTLNRLIITLQESVLKLEQASKKDNVEQVNAMKEFILKTQKSIAEEMR